jgi:hypothetical protein
MENGIYIFIMEEYNLLAIILELEISFIYLNEWNDLFVFIRNAALRHYLFIILEVSLSA